ncbi:hypothetical protein AB0L40_06725 [Patulibacter sp. NPDC049589]|uniref:hypothetical protein n=1 Tax=Patulibacter sp. NPDC049589 TaxID=3154731 RepID=UPI00343BCE49
MRLTSVSAAVVTAGILALSGCGGSDSEDVRVVSTGAKPAATDTQGAVVTSTQAAPQQTVVVPPPSTVVVPSTTGTSTTSGGTAPPTTTVTVQKPPTVAGDQPTITVRADGTARTTAADDGQAQIWCDAARQGSYDDQLGDATTLVIAVAGSDQVTRCALPR